MVRKGRNAHTHILLFIFLLRTLIGCLKPLKTSKSGNSVSPKVGTWNK